MSNAALAVGVSVSGAFVLIVVAAVVLICVLNNRSPRRHARGPKTKIRNVKKGTENIKRKAEKLKADKSQSSCCVFMACCSGGHQNGPFPDPPFGVELEDPTASEITIIWNAPENENQIVIILGYNIYKRLKTTPDDWTKVGKLAAEEEELEFRITGLVANKAYVFGVSSNGRTGESTIVETQPTVLKKDPVRPGAPAELDVTNKASSSITLSWKPPRKSGFSRIHTYYLLMKDCERNADWMQLTSLPAFDRYMDYKVTGLKPKHPYRFRVNAQNAAGLGPYAETVTHETDDSEPEPPGKPEGPIRYSRVSHNSITLSWRPPRQDGGKPVSGFAVEYKEKDDKRWKKADVCEADKTKLTVSKLQEDIEYIFRIISINVVGNSKPMVGPKIRTKLLEIPVSRRSSRANTSRDSFRGKPSEGDTLGTDTDRSRADLEANSLQDKLEGLDPQLEADPFVPKSDFFAYDETNSGNISNRHSDNKTKHSQFSPLPAPPPSQLKKRSGGTQMGPKQRHSNFSPLPRPQSYQYTNGRLRQSGDILEESDDDDDDNDNVGDGSMYRNNAGPGTHHRAKFSKDSENRSQNSILTELPDISRPGGIVRHQPTPSNIAYAHSRF